MKSVFNPITPPFDKVPNSLGDLTTRDHDLLTGLSDDDHAQYIRTDGTRAFIGDQSFAGFKAVAMACDNGSILPTSPANGQWFRHTPIGRDWLYQAIRKSVVSWDEANSIITANSHGLSTGDLIYFSAGSIVPLYLSTEIPYYVIRLTDNTFKIATTFSFAISGLHEEFFAGGGSADIYLWQPIFAFGQSTLYCNSAALDNGETLSFGYGPSIDEAFGSLRFCINQLPPTFSGNIVIQLSAGTFNEQVIISGKNPTGNFWIVIKGTMTNVLAQRTATGANRSYIEDTTAVFTPVTRVAGAGAYDGKIMRVTGGTGIDRFMLIWNTNTTLVGGIVDMRSNYSRSDSSKVFGTIPAAGSTFVVEDWNTTIEQNGCPGQNTSAGTINVVSGQKNISIQYLHMLATTGNFGIHVSNGGFAEVQACKAKANANAFDVGIDGYLELYGCYGYSSSQNGLNVSSGTVRVNNCQFNGNAGRGIRARGGAKIYDLGCACTNNSLSGIGADGNAWVEISGFGVSKGIKRGNGTYGIDMASGSVNSNSDTTVGVANGAVVLGTDNQTYQCILAHTSGATNRPITGASWATYWVLYGGGTSSRFQAWETGVAYTAQTNTSGSRNPATQQAGGTDI